MQIRSYPCPLHATGAISYPDTPIHVPTMYTDTNDPNPPEINITTNETPLSQSITHIPKHLPIHQANSLISQTYIPNQSTTTTLPTHYTIPLASIHPMQTRSKSGIYKPKTFHTLKYLLSINRGPIKPTQ